MSTPTAPAPLRVDKLLGELLEATATKTAASRRIDRLRDVLDTEARRRYAAEGAAPTWKAPKLGSVRLDPKDARAFVDDADAFASYVAQRFPSEVTARLELDAGQLEGALEALSFAGVTVHRSAVEVRPTFVASLLEGAEVLYDDSPAALEGNAGKPVTVVARPNPATGELERVDGAGVLAPSATLVVTLDRTRKAAELARVDEQLETELAELGVEAPAEPTPEEQAHAADVGARLMASVTAGIPVIVDDTIDPDTAVLRREGATDVAIRLPAGNPGPPPGKPTGRAGRVVAPSPGDPGYSLLGTTTAPATTGGPELLPGSAAAPEASSLEPLDESAIAVQLAEQAIPGGEDPVDPTRTVALPTPPVDDVVTELTKLNTDDLKRAARARRVALSGTKVLLASKLAKAGVTVADVVELRRQLDESLGRT